MTDPIRDALAELVACCDDDKFPRAIQYTRWHDAWAAARDALSTPPAPSVPREPTPEMFDAALPNGNAWTAGTIWRAMYDAAINDQSGGGAVAPEQANAEKAGVASGPPDPIAAPAYCTHARKMGARGSECVIRCGLPVAPVAAPAQPDDDVVRRFCCFTAEDGVYESPTGEHVAYTDYAAVSDALRRERERAESAEGDALREIVNEERQIAKELARQLVGVKAERDALLLRIPNVSKVEAECRTLEDWKLRAMHMEFGWSSCSRCAAQLQGRAESAEAERDALRADAERYRHIRPMFRAFSAHVDGMHSWCATGELARMKGPTFDAAIDAARKV